MEYKIGDMFEYRYHGLIYITEILSEEEQNHRLIKLHGKRLFKYKYITSINDREYIFYEGSNKKQYLKPYNEDKLIEELTDNMFNWKLNDNTQIQYDIQHKTFYIHQHGESIALRLDELELLLNTLNEAI